MVPRRAILAILLLASGAFAQTQNPGSVNVITTPWSVNWLTHANDTAALNDLGFDAWFQTLLPASNLGDFMSIAGFGAPMILAADDANNLEIATTFEVDGWVDARWYGADETGGVDSTAAIQAAIDATTTGIVYLPRGTYDTNGTITLSADRVSLVGDGPQATIINFAPTADDVCIDIYDTTPSVVYQMSVRGIGFASSDTTYEKTAIRVVDGSGVCIEDIATYPWGGDASIGLRVCGREQVVVRDCRWYAPIPIQISDNPHDTIDLDHSRFENLFCINDSADNAHANILIDSGVNLTNVTFEGIGCSGGTYAIDWNDSTSTANSANVRIADLRAEMGDDSAAYVVRIVHNFNLYGLTLENIYGDSARNGYYLRQCYGAALHGVVYNGGAGRTALEVDSTVIGLTLAGCWWQAGSSATLTGQRTLYATPKHPNTAPLPRTAYYDSTTNAVKDLTFGGALGEASITVASGSDVEIATQGAVGVLIVACTNTASAIYTLCGANHVTQEMSDPYTLYSPTAGTPSMVNIYWDGGTSRYRLQNNTASSRNFRLSLVGGYTAF